MTKIASLGILPKVLNGFAVVKHCTHEDNDVVTVMVQIRDDYYVVATWNPGDLVGWIWGYYYMDKETALKDFYDTCRINDRRA
jgi:hypothetical protein